MRDAVHAKWSICDKPLYKLLLWELTLVNDSGLMNLRRQVEQNGCRALPWTCWYKSMTAWKGRRAGLIGQIRVAAIGGQGLGRYISLYIWLEAESSNQHGC